MTVEGYNRFCGGLPATSHVVQWGGAHVWKVAGKVFAIAWFDADEPDNEDDLLVTFKVSDLSFELLKEMPGCRPAPYLASRGMKWIQRTNPESMDDAALRDYITESHRIVASGLPKRVQRELNIGGSAPLSASAGHPAQGRPAPKTAKPNQAPKRTKNSEQLKQRPASAARGGQP